MIEGQADLLKSSLRAAQRDRERLRRLVSEREAEVSRWMQQAFRDWRLALARGEMDQAREGGCLIGAVMEARATDSARVAAQHHRDAMAALLMGMETASLGDSTGAARLLTPIATSEQYGEHYRWAAWIWNARALAAAGEPDRADEGLAHARRLAQALDEQAQHLTDCQMFDQKLLEAKPKLLLGRIRTLLKTIEASGDPRVSATAQLTYARALAASGKQADGIAAAEKSREKDPQWMGPLVFLADRRLDDGDIEAAEKLLRAADSTGKARLRLELIEAVRAGRTSLERVVDYLSLLMQPPSGKVIKRLRTLAESSRGLPQFRGTLAWKLMQLGRYSESEQHFRLLASKDLPAGLRSSVVFGLATVEITRVGRADEVGQLTASLQNWTARATLELCETRRAAANEQPSPEEYPSSDKPQAEQVPQVQTGSPQTGTEPSKENRFREPLVTPPGAHPVVPPAGSPQAAPSAFTGNLSILGIPQLLEFLRSTKRTGVLEVSSEAGDARITMRDGSVVAAQAPGHSGIVDQLIREGMLSQAQGERASRLAAAPPKRTLGFALIELRFADEATLHTVAERQIRQAIRALIGWNAGTFIFHQQTKLDLELFPPPALDPQRLLFDLAMEDGDAGEEEDITGEIL